MTGSPRPPQVPIAIVGIAALAPGASDAEGFWRTVLTGQDLITDVPDDHWLIDDYYDPDPSAPDRTYARRGAFLPAIDFDPAAYGIPPNALPATDTTQLLSLAVAERVLADAGLDDPAAFDGERTGVILGTAALELLHTMSNRMQRPVWLKSLRESGVPEDRAQAVCDRIAAHYVPWQEATFPGVLSNVVAGRIASRFDLHGTNFTADAACGSSLAAVTAAVNELAVGTADLMVTGGVDTLNDILMYMCFSKTPALSQKGDCRPFSDAADGTMLGEALVMFVLKRLADAERDGDRIYAVLRGIGSSSDGRGSAIYTPLPAGQARALRRAYESAGYGPDSVELVEAHGTGTTAGDAAEFTALRTVFEESGRADPQWCALGSVKSQIGHTKSAAGAVGLLKAVLALQHKILPPTIKVDRPNPALELESSPLYLNTRARPWVKPPSQPRRASVSSFGFGGTNFHLTLEEYVAAPGSPACPAPLARTAPTELLLFSGSSPEELLRRTEEAAAGVRPFAVEAANTQRSFRPSDPHRLALTASDPEDLAARLDQATALVRARSDRPLTAALGISHGAGPAMPGRLALLFSGQGSQYTGMGADLAMHLPQAREVWDRAAELALDDELPLHRVVFPVPAFTEEDRAAQQALLTRTEWAQPALAVQSTALLAALRAAGVEPDCVGGHSFGELVALHAAGVMDEGCLLRLARKRGELMRDASSEPGAMLAVVGTPREDIVRLLDGFDDAVWLANDNSPGQVVLSGRTDAVADLERRLTGQGVTTRRLRAAGAFHSPLMSGAGRPFAEFLNGLDLQPPKIDVYGNADAEPYPQDTGLVRERLAEHLLSPVRFTDEIERMYKSGVRTFVEVGAGATLTGLVGEILGDREHLAVSLDHSGLSGVTAFQQALGTLAVAGVSMDLESLWSPYRAGAEETRKPRKQRPRMAVRISGANHGSHYPPPGGGKALPQPVATDEGPVAMAASGSMEAATPQATSPAVPTPPAAMAPGSSLGVRQLAPASGATTVHTLGDAPFAAVPTTDPWLQAFQETQRQAAEAHAEFQRTMAEAHLMFLRTTEASSLGLAGVAAPAPAAMPVPSVALPLPEPAPQAAPPWAESPLAEPSSVLAHLPQEQSPPPVDETAAAANGVDAVPTEVPPARVTVESVLFEVVSDKTGFPIDILEPQMDLEADLGIDSIKRVQILSVLRERIPALAQVDANELTLLRTLQHITDKLREAENPTPEPSTAPLVTEPPPTPEPPSKKDDPATRLVRAITSMRPAPLPGLELAGLRDGPVIVTDEGTGVAQRLVEKLCGHGIRATVAAEPGAETRGVVLLASLRPAPSPGDAAAVNREAFRVARSAARHMGARGGVFVTVQDTGGDFGLGGGHGHRAWLGGPAALARTAAKEWPEARVKAVDCERGHHDADALAEVIATELLQGGSSSDIGLPADGTRQALWDTPGDEPGGSGPLGPDSVIVATGGARGVTALALRALAEAHLPSIVLIGRTELTAEAPGLSEAKSEKELRSLLTAQARKQSKGGKAPGPAEIGTLAARVLAVREIRATLDAITASGARVRYLSVDTRDAEALARGLDEARKDFGPISGIVHGAGILADSRLADKTDAQFADVFDTKVEGLRALLAATADDPLDLVCVFSSVAGRFGNTGQGDYAMANEVLAQVASTVAADRPRCLVKSIAWGPWDGGMVGPELREHFRSQGVALIDPDVGARAFVRELNAGPGPVRVTLTAGDAAASLGSPAGTTVSGDIMVSVRSHPYLADHAIAGSPVAPMALVMEWFLGAARIWRPDAPGFVLRDLEVLSRIELAAFPDRGDRLMVRGLQRPDEGKSLLRLELTGSSSQPHYRTTVEALAAPPVPSRAWQAPVDIGGRPTAEIYDGHVLFHGPAFQSMTSLEGISAAGAEAGVTGVRTLGWPGRAWQQDPAALDAGLQLALKWAEHARGAAFLPMGAAEIRTEARGPVAEDARCLVLARESAGEFEASCDIVLLEPDGSVHSELLGVALVQRPDTSAAHGPAPTRTPQHSAAGRKAARK
ncbi:type I polyketide synthase [Streptomyces sp. NBC_00878]|uniref:type I polyketide synthase n=1 Tax=Streptomyces sp. NBC_00878 TaxID=2975854 RepID=UPI00225C2034|nr:type I polyketide synthase [Streptomyces sp. NBC_00878]MCX4903171.1 SDR family oxidoreductase [Streptomyces sp. NBC_00878]